MTGPIPGRASSSTVVAVLRLISRPAGFGLDSWERSGLARAFAAGGPRAALAWPTTHHARPSHHLCKRTVLPAGSAGRPGSRRGAGYLSDLRVTTADHSLRLVTGYLSSLRRSSLPLPRLRSPPLAGRLLPRRLPPRLIEAMRQHVLPMARRPPVRQQRFQVPLPPPHP